MVTEAQNSANERLNEYMVEYKKIEEEKLRIEREKEEVK